MNRTAFKIAASATIVAMTMVACTAQSEAMRRMGSAAPGQSRSDRQAGQLHEQARRALQQGQLGEALTAMENAVALAPRDAGYRLLLAEIYMKSGRFDSARATFTDVVEIDPSNVRGRLSLALMQVAVGRPQAAVAQLDELQGRAGAADLGLAYALAGMPERAIEILEPAARGQGATARLRQNLALSYALAGDWQRARTVAAQDLSPADLGPRLQQWAAMARPDVRSSQVASLLGVNPIQDPGQPVRLALAPPAPVLAEAYAEAAPEPAPPVADTESAPAPVAVYAEASPLPVVAPEPTPVSDWGPAPESANPTPMPIAPPAPAPTMVTEADLPPPEAPSYYLPAPPAPPVERSAEEVRYAAAARTLTRPAPAVVRTASVSLPPAPVFRRQAPRPAVPEVRRGNSRYVVQLGSFSVEANAERAWVDAERRYGLRDHQPLTTTFDHQGRTLHRVSIAGFAGQADAQRMCQSIKARGGACFVRGHAGDAAVRWAARYGPSRSRNV